MPLTPETTTMAAARPWSLLKFGDDIWLKALGTARLVFLRNMEITAFPAPVEEVDARHGPFEYLAPCTGRSSERRVLDDIGSAMGLTDITDGSSILHTIGKLLEEHDEVVGLRTLMTNRVEEIQRLREELSRQWAEVPSTGKGAVEYRPHRWPEAEEIKRLQTANATLRNTTSETGRRELGHIEEIKRLREALLAKEETIKAFDLDRKTERQRAYKLAGENNDLRAALRKLIGAP